MWQINKRSSFFSEDLVFFVLEPAAYTKLQFSYWKLLFIDFRTWTFRPFGLLFHRQKQCFIMGDECTCKGCDSPTYIFALVVGRVLIWQERFNSQGSNWAILSFHSRTTLEAARCIGRQGASQDVFLWKKKDRESYKCRSLMCVESQMVNSSLSLKPYILNDNLLI